MIILYYRVLEGGFASAAVLISLGAVLGKLNPFQILLMSFVEAPFFVLNSYIGYTILGVADIGKQLLWTEETNNSFEILYYRLQEETITYVTFYPCLRRSNVYSCIWSIFWISS